MVRARDWIGWLVAGLVVVGCKEENPAFDGADGGPGTSAATQDDGGPDSGPVTTTDPPGSTSTVATSGSSGDPTATTSGVVSTTSGDGTTTSGMDTTAGESSTGACEMCGGVDCIDLMTDNDNCGKCDNKCNPGNEMCVMGTCM